MKITKKQLERLILQEVRIALQEQMEFGDNPLFARWGEWFNSPWRTFINNFRQGASSAGTSFGDYGSYDSAGANYYGDTGMSGSMATETNPSSTYGTRIGAPILDTLQITPQNRSNFIIMTANLVLNQNVITGNSREQLETQYRNTINSLRSNILTNVRNSRRTRLQTLLTAALNAMITQQRSAPPPNLQQQVQAIANNEANTVNVAIEAGYSSERKIQNLRINLIVNGTDFSTSIFQAARTAGYIVDPNQERQYQNNIKNNILRIAQNANAIYQNATIS